MIKVKAINKSNYPLPEYATSGSAGMDLRANIEQEITLKPLERKLFPTGLFIQLPLGYEAQVRPRSGLALKKGLTVLNAPGTVDADYRGEIGVVLINLSNCGNTNYVVNTKKFPKDFCSYKCYEEWQKWNKPPNCSCEVCGKPMYIKPYRLGRVENGITCSKECSNKLREEFMSGENNHQYGLIGDKNSSFGGEELISEFGYILVYCPGHPFPHDKTNRCTRVFKHRLVIEENYQLFDAKYFIQPPKHSINFQ